MSDRFKFFVLLILFVSFYVLDAHAQQPIYLEDEGSGLWQQDAFIESDELDDPLSESSGEYIGDEKLKAYEEAARMGRGPQHNIAAALEKDSRLLPENMVYGIGTGLALGGWIALLQGGDARDNTRYLGVGLVGGILIAMAVGTKSVYQPLIRNARAQAPPTERGPSFSPVFFAEHRQTRSGVGLNFKF